jgi:hypothetical protein
MAISVIWQEGGRETVVILAVVVVVAGGERIEVKHNCHNIRAIERDRETMDKVGPRASKSRKCINQIK